MSQMKGSKNVSKMAFFLLPLGIAVNFIGGQVATLLNLPIYLDAIGTMVVAALCGPVYSVATALVTGLVLWFFFPNSALMGASGVVFMLIVLASFAGMRTGTIPLTLILVLILYLGSEIFQAVTGTAGLAQLTHNAGGVLGMIFGFTWSRGRRGAR